MTPKRLRCFVVGCNNEHSRCHLKPVHNKDDNYKDNNKDIVLKSFSILKNSRDHTTAITIKAQRNNIVGITFRTIFFQLMKDTNIDTQNPSCYNELENLKQQKNMRYIYIDDIVHWIGRQYSYLYSYCSWCERGFTPDIWATKDTVDYFCFWRECSHKSFEIQLHQKKRTYVFFLLWIFANHLS